MTRQHTNSGGSHTGASNVIFMEQHVAGWEESVQQEATTSAINFFFYYTDAKLAINVECLAARNSNLLPGRHVEAAAFDAVSVRFLFRPSSKGL